MTATEDRTELHMMSIAGEFRAAADGGYLDAVNPATGKVIGRIPQATPADVNDAVAGGARAQRDWIQLHPVERSRRMNALADLIVAQGDELAMLDVVDNGSPISEMRNDIQFAAAMLRYYAGLVLQARGTTVPTTWDRVNYTLRQPYGVVGRIVPFNHPLLFAASKAAAPLAAGNAVIMKPSEHTSLSALRFGELAQQALPPGLVSIVTGDGAVSGDALVTHPDVRRLAFIGSADTGMRIIARASSVNVKNVSLELGGKNPLVVFPDADVDKAIDGAVRGMNFTWQGQSCGSTSRLLVHQSLYRDFVDRLAAKVGAIRSGDPTEPTTQTGALVNRSQLDKVLSFIRIGRDDGARLVAGGVRLTDGDYANGTFVRPTVFADVEPDSRLAQNEIFGPVLAAMPFNDYDEAVRIANSVRYGLTASVFTRDLATTHRFARDIQSGYVWVNEVSQHVPGTPFGGFKDSGLGREEDVDELLSYTQTKNVHVNFEE